MLKKLKSVLKNQKDWPWPLILKAAIFSFLLALAGSYGWLSVIFVFIALFFYFRPFLNIRQFLSSFLILAVLGLLFVFHPSIFNFQSSIPVALFFGFLFFLLLGIKNLIFIKGREFYHLFNGLLMLAIFVFFFAVDKSHLFFIEYLLFFLVVFFLLKEFLSFSVADNLNPQKRNLVACAIAFLILQLVWVVGLLPIGFFNAASLILLITLILQDFILHSFSGTINRRIILRNITVFLVLVIVIFGASKWAP